jgi:hypothetical protein
VVAAVVPMLATEGFDALPHALARKSNPAVPVTNAARVVAAMRSQETSAS